jgi:hypothetical protein
VHRFQRHLNDVVTIAIEESDDTCLIKLDLCPSTGARR